MDLPSCPDMAVPTEIMRHIVGVESSYNPYSIGVVRGRLVRQPRSLNEALATVRSLEERGLDFSVGLAQINRRNLAAFGLAPIARAFDTCANLQTGSRILADCYRRHKTWGRAFSCYYSGNARTGYRDGYVQKVFASIAASVRGVGVGAPTPGASPVPRMDMVAGRESAAGRANHRGSYTSRKQALNPMAVSPLNDDPAFATSAQHHAPVADRPEPTYSATGDLAAGRSASRAMTAPVETASAKASPGGDPSDRTQVRTGVISQQPPAPRPGQDEALVF